MVLDRLEAEGLAVKGRRRRWRPVVIDPWRHYLFHNAARSHRWWSNCGGSNSDSNQKRRTTPPSASNSTRKVITDIGPFCQGCGADYAYENLTLLCPPCNKEKRNRYTLIGLQGYNRANGFMPNENNLRMGRQPEQTAP